MRKVYGPFMKYVWRRGERVAVRESGSVRVWEGVGFLSTKYVCIFKIRFVTLVNALHIINPFSFSFNKTERRSHWEPSPAQNANLSTLILSFQSNFCENTADRKLDVMFVDDYSKWQEATRGEARGRNCLNFIKQNYPRIYLLLKTRHSHTKLRKNINKM